MKTVQVSRGERSYEIFIESGLLGQVGELLEHRGIHPTIFLISNSRVFELYGEDLGWLEGGELVGLPEVEYVPAPDRNLRNQRGLRFM